MFTGLVDAMGGVASVERREGATRLTVEARGVAGTALIQRLREGDSVAVSGVCLTALDIAISDEAGRFAADLAQETMARTTLGALRTGSAVNLELPTAAGAPLGGHIVQGHVDGVGTLLALDAVRPGAKTTDWVLRIRVPGPLLRYVAAQGSITVEGISLTVAEVAGDEVRIAIIPHTYAATNLGTLAVGDGVNLETDVLAKYADSRRQSQQQSAITAEYLLANGY